MHVFSKRVTSRDPAFVYPKYALQLFLLLHTGNLPDSIFAQQLSKACRNVFRLCFSFPSCRRQNMIVQKVYTRAQYFMIVAFYYKPRVRSAEILKCYTQ